MEIAPGGYRGLYSGGIIGLTPQDKARSGVYPEFLAWPILGARNHVENGGRASVQVIRLGFQSKQIVLPDMFQAGGSIGFGKRRRGQAALDKRAGLRKIVLKP